MRVNKIFMHHHDHFHTHRKIKKNNKWKKIEEFVQKQMQRYIRIHKEHEKELRYIG